MSATNTMNFKGYLARVEFDPDESILFGHLIGINDVVGFHADNVEDLKIAFREAVDDYIDTCAKAGKNPEKPYSGNLGLRVSPETHASAVRAAELSGKSLNQWADCVLKNAASV